VRAWRCSICGEVTLARTRPSDCPFCGADEKYIGDVRGNPNDLGDAVINSTDRANLETSLAMERGDVRRYTAMANAALTETDRHTYKRIARIESEHVQIFATLLGAPQGGPVDVMELPQDINKAVAGAITGEESASATYAKFARQAAITRLHVVWSALAEVENGHWEVLTESGDN
jgi:rubrerythrin